MIFDIPDGFSEGSYIYTINFTDNYGNFIIDNVTFTVIDTTDSTPNSIPWMGIEFFLIIGIISIITTIMDKIKK